MVDGIEGFGELLDGVGVRAGEPLGGRPQQVERALQDIPNSNLPPRGRRGQPPPLPVILGRAEANRPFEM